MRYLYSLIMYMLTPYLLLRLWWKGREMPAYRERIAERFFLDKPTKINVDIWIHAVSLGEVIAASVLIEELLAKKWRILITTMTATGSKQVITRFANSVEHRYVPYDLPCVLRAFFKAYQPRVGVIIETELWPNLISTATRAGVPLLLANARLSERATRGYKKMKWLFKPLLNQFNGILAQSLDDAKRFKMLGCDEQRISVFGNIKFDVQTQNINKDVFLQLKNSWGNTRVVIIAASTHEDEEQQILSQWVKLQKNIPNVLLLLAPRHPERFQKIYQLAQQLGFNTGLRSKINTLTPNNEVVVLDSMGELLGFYQISDYAFVGGSLVSVGGHNVLEAIAMRVPVLSGKYMHNFKSICQDLVEAQAIELVNNADELVAKIIELQKNEHSKRVLIDNATRVLERNKGALNRYVAKIESLLIVGK